MKMKGARLLVAAAAVAAGTVNLVPERPAGAQPSQAISAAPAPAPAPPGSELDLNALDAPHAKTTELLAAPWAELLPRAPLGENARHFFATELRSRGPITHVRLNIFPDGGVSRLRIWGTPDG